MADPKPNNVKTFNFTTEELSFLSVRQQTLNMTAIINNDTNLVMQSYIQGTVLPRLGVDPQKYDVSYNIVQGTIMLTDKIILPNGQPVKPPEVVSK